MGLNKQFGDEGEKEVVDLIPCPNCGKELMVLPPNFPLFDVQCSGCSFRAQVKTSKSRPRPVIFGAGWDIMDKVLKAGYITPPLITNFKWQEKGVERREIRFYPFVPKRSLQKYRLPPTAKRANYWMFRYVGLDELPYFVLFNNLP